MYRKRAVILVCIIFSLVIIFGCSVNNETEISLNTEETNQETESLNGLSQKLIVTSGEWKPYVSEDLEGYGFSTEILREAFSEVGIEIEVELYPWVRAVEVVKNNEAFGTYPWSNRGEREKDYFFSDSMFQSTLKFLYLEGNEKVPKTYDELEELSDLKIGGVAGYYYVDELENHGLTIDISTSESDSIKKLYNGRYDIVPVDVLNTSILIEEIYPDEIEKFKYMEPPQDILDMRLMVGKSYPEAEKLLELFNKGLKEIKENNKWEEILEKHDVFSNRNIKIACTDYPPYTIVEDGEYSGIGVETVKEALKRLGYSDDEYTFVTYPWIRMIEMARNGEVDMFLDLLNLEERKDFLDFSDEIFAEYTISVITSESNYSESKATLKVFEETTVGVVRGYHYSPEIDEAIIKNKKNVIEVPSTMELLEQLANGRLKYAIEYDAAAKYLSQNNEEFKNIEILSPSLVTTKNYYGYPNVLQYKGLREAMDEKIKEMRLDGTIDRIRGNYGQ